jgi:hypothetical protein
VIYKKDQYVVCRYEGDNGDLIAGRVISARNRNGGHVLLENLFTGSVARKGVDVLTRRNAVVPKKLATRVVEAFHQDGRKAARTLAVRLVRELTDDEDEVKRVTVSVLTYKNKHCSDDCAFITHGEDSEYCTLFNEVLDKDVRRERHPSIRCAQCVKEEVK